MKYLRPFFESKNNLEQEIQDIFEDYLDLFDHSKISMTMNRNGKIFVHITRDVGISNFRKRLHASNTLDNCIKRFESLHEYNLIDVSSSPGGEVISFNHRDNPHKESKGINISDIVSFCENEKIPLYNSILVLSNIGEWELEGIKNIDIRKSENLIHSDFHGDFEYSNISNFISDCQEELIDGAENHPDVLSDLGDDYNFTFADGFSMNDFLNNDLYLSKTGEHKIVKLCKFDDLTKIIDDESFLSKYDEWIDEFSDGGGTLILICEY